MTSVIKFLQVYGVFPSIWDKMNGFVNLSQMALYNNRKLPRIFHLSNNRIEFSTTVLFLNWQFAVKARSCTWVIALSNYVVPPTRCAEINRFHIIWLNPFLSSIINWTGPFFSGDLTNSSRARLPVCLEGSGTPGFYLRTLAVYSLYLYGWFVQL